MHPSPAVERIACQGYRVCDHKNWLVAWIFSAGALAAFVGGRQPRAVLDSRVRACELPAENLKLPGMWIGGLRGIRGHFQLYGVIAAISYPSSTHTRTRRWFSARANHSVAQNNGRRLMRYNHTEVRPLRNDTTASCLSFPPL